MNRDAQVGFVAALGLAVGFLFGAAGFAGCGPERPTVQPAPKCVVMIPTEAR